MLINETHFTSKSHFTIPKYQVCYTNHPDGTAHGGTAILVKSTIAYYEQLPHAEAELQATICVNRFSGTPGTVPGLALMPIRLNLP
jgi:hypothetical protein